MRIAAETKALRRNCYPLWCAFMWNNGHLLSSAVKCLLSALLTLAASAGLLIYGQEAPSRYEFRQEHDPNGIGKFYLGREIAQVMGHPGANWLERREREEEEKPELLLQALKLRPSDVVADIGAGTGYFSWRIAKKLGTEGKVYAADIQQEMLDLLSANMKQRGVTNVIPVLGALTETRLPTNSVDLVIMVDVYHEFSHPYEMLHSICNSLKPGGRVAFVEYRAEDPSVPIKEAHKMSEKQIRREAQEHPLTWVETLRILPSQHIVVFKKRE